MELNLLRSTILEQTGQYRVDSKIHSHPVFDDCPNILGAPVPPAAVPPDGFPKRLVEVVLVPEVLLL